MLRVRYAEGYKEFCRRALAFVVQGMLLDAYFENEDSTCKTIASVALLTPRFKAIFDCR